jgi:geranylgeranyl diphosphate synthase type I
VTYNELAGFLGHWLPKVEAEMQAVLRIRQTAAEHYAMMHYHMGWMDEQFRPQYFPAGKRLRPILCLLACAEVGGDPVSALPAAAAIEIVHNFSLVHDDIEDGDEVRRHRPTAWKVWGAPQAINMGDGMYTLAFVAMQQLARHGVEAKIVLKALDLFAQTCLELTEGQHLDMHFEQQLTVTVAEYMEMIQRKTAALIGASVAIGALIGGAKPEQIQALQRFGRTVGLAFQIQDDILGVWGDPEETGKAVGNDILRRKKSLPILHALHHPDVGRQLQTLLSGEIGASHLPQALVLLEEAGTRPFAEAQVRAQHDAGVAALRDALGMRAAQSALLALAEGLLQRRS